MDKIVPWQASCLISAQRKTGKTTFVLNLARSLLTGEDFLGRFAVRPINGDVAILNYEVSAAQLARWADEAGVPRGRLFLVNLRGRGNPLGDDDGRMRLAALLRSRGTEALLCDPFGRAYTGVSQNDPGEVGRWLDDLEHFARTDVGVNDLMLTAHAGWEGERTRGASALEDWPDSIITMTRGGRVDGDGGEDARYLKAIGRDVELEEDRLNFDMEPAHSRCPERAHAEPQQPSITATNSTMPCSESSQRSLASRLGSLAPRSDRSASASSAARKCMQPGG
jgi:hypothetical protein